jgi:hypothetical protein
VKLTPHTIPVHHSHAGTHRMSNQTDPRNSLRPTGQFLLARVDGLPTPLERSNSPQYYYGYQLPPNYNPRSQKGPALILGHNLDYFPDLEILDDTSPLPTLVKKANQALTPEDGFDWRIVRGKPAMHIDWAGMQDFDDEEEEELDVDWEEPDQGDVNE